MHGIGKIFKTKYGGLIFSLLAGAAYYVIILNFILKHTTSYGGALLGFFFAPAIIAGAALIILTTIKQLEADEAFKKINLFLYFHLVLILLGIVFLADMLIK